MAISFGISDLNPVIGAGKEWLLTNGLGGFASSTIIGENTRRYHGLLLVSLDPPVDRRLLVAKLDEDLYVNKVRYVLGTNRVRNGYAQEGYRYLLNFQRHPFPTYIYQIDGIFLIKTIIMIHGENTTVVHYRVINPFQKNLSLYIFPLVNCRDYHHITQENDWPVHQEFISNRQVEIAPYSGAPHVYMATDHAEYVQSPSWYKGMYYYMEEYRGLPCFEDHFIPGYFTLHSQTSEEFSITFSTSEIAGFDYEHLEKKERERRNALLELAGHSDDFVQKLVLAADDFIVERASTGKKSIIAGYPWFNDWGRDAMIAFPGLTLCTRRFQDAREILATFSAYTKEGLVPNMFTGPGEEPLYNTVDASLWYFYAIQKYLAYTKDYPFIKEHLWETMRDVIYYYKIGTRYGIAMDDDGLIIAGTPGLQLTWMDAKVGDWVVTPRQGKPVEINALWYNALMFMSELTGIFDKKDEYSELAEQVRQNFLLLFWNEEKQCLYDVVDGAEKDGCVRPNQIIAVSLPYSALPQKLAQAVVERVFDELYAVYGFRSLSPQEQQFQGHYGGDQYYRDGAYHQGTAWSWLLGHFVTAYRKAFNYSPESLLTVRLLLAPMRDHLRDHGIGTISEIFDGEYPFTPRGCFAQAWGVAEVLRCYLEDVEKEKLVKL
ncbi:MAG: amylo-alpha-1,6-glucosidase [Syntrophaceticus sp.]